MPSSSLQRALAAVLLGAVGLIICESAFGQHLGLVRLDDVMLHRLSRAAGLEDAPLVLSKDGSGRTLFIAGRKAQGGSDVAVVAPGGVTCRHFASGYAVLGEGGDLVSSVVDHRFLAFQDGTQIPIAFTNAISSRFGFSPGGEFFFLNQAFEPEGDFAGWKNVQQPATFLDAGGAKRDNYFPVWAGVFRGGTPRVPLLKLPRDFLALHLFAKGDTLWAFGRRFVFPTKPNPKDSGAEDVCWGLMFSNSLGGYRLAKQYDLRQYGGVIDLNPSTGELLVQSKGEVRRSWGLLTLENGKYSSIGNEKGQALFLDQELRRYLDSLR